MDYSIDPNLAVPIDTTESLKTYNNPEEAVCEAEELISTGSEDAYCEVPEGELEGEALACYEPEQQPMPSVLRYSAEGNHHEVVENQTESELACHYDEEQGLCTDESLCENGYVRIEIISAEQCYPADTPEGIEINRRHLTSSDPEIREEGRIALEHGAEHNPTPELRYAASQALESAGLYCQAEAPASPVNCPQPQQETLEPPPNIEAQSLADAGDIDTGNPIFGENTGRAGLPETGLPEGTPIVATPHVIIFADNGGGNTDNREGYGRSTAQTDDPPKLAGLDLGSSPVQDLVRKDDVASPEPVITPITVSERRPDEPQLPGEDGDDEEREVPVMAHLTNGGAGSSIISPDNPSDNTVANNAGNPRPLHTTEERGGYSTIWGEESGGPTLANSTHPAVTTFAAASAGALQGIMEFIRPNNRNAAQRGDGTGGDGERYASIGNKNKRDPFSGGSHGGGTGQNGNPYSYS